MDQKPDATVLIENAIASKLSELRAKVSLFAEAFRSTGQAQQLINVLVGHSQSEYVWDSEVYEPVGVELALFEIRCESADIHNHQAALSYLTQAMQLLRGFEPYTGIRPLQPVRYAPSGFNTQAGVWSYTGIVRAVIIRPSEYELIEELPPIENISIGLYRRGYLQRQIEVDLTPLPPP